MASSAPFVEPSAELLTSNIIPKHLTRASELALHADPPADGTRVTVAVLDTGVDPGAPGLAHTTNGDPKILDVVDCTCSGDVDVSTVASVRDGYLLGLSGRKLYLSQQLRTLNPSGKYHVGLKPAYHLFPRPLVERLQKERREVWRRELRQLLTPVRQAVIDMRRSNDSHLEEFEARQTILTAMDKNYRDHGPLYDCVVFFDGTTWRAVVDTTEKGCLEQCTILEDYVINRRYSTFQRGIMMNYCVKIYDQGRRLSIVVDGGSHGTHVAGILAANFPDAPHLNGLAPGAQIVSLKIGDSRLAGMETHQGLIRAVNYLLLHSKPRPHPESVNRDPDAQPTSDTSSLPQRNAKVSEEPSQKHSVDTPNPQPSSAQSNAFPRIDVVNMSYGEQSRDVNRGLFVKLVEKLVYEHNVLFLSSAGNAGPGLSSVSSPGGTTEAIIGVGAYFTPGMLTEAYSLLPSDHPADEPLKSEAQFPNRPPQANVSSPKKFFSSQEPVTGTPYSWTSRGPVSDGAMGVSICAPGGAIAPVPAWMMCKKMLMNGTSMASPSAAGTVAAILSYLKYSGIPYTSALVRRAIENTARCLRAPHAFSTDSPSTRETFWDKHRYSTFATGNGSIDALSACNYIKNHMWERQLGDEQNQQSESAANDMTSNISAQLSSLQLAQDFPAEKRYRDIFNDCGNSESRLEEWRLKVRVEDASPLEDNSNNAGFRSMNANRGILIRGSAKASRTNRATVYITPVGPSEDCILTKRALASMEVNISITAEASWVEVPSSILLLGGGRSFPVRIYPQQLKKGEAHFTEILGYVYNPKSRLRNGGPVFRVPVTVQRPSPLVDNCAIKPIENISFSPALVLRRFYEAPLASSYVILKITAASSFDDSRSKGGEAKDHPAHAAVESSDVLTRRSPLHDDATSSKLRSPTAPTSLYRSTNQSGSQLKEHKWPQLTPPRQENSFQGVGASLSGESRAPFQPKSPSVKFDPLVESTKDAVQCPSTLSNEYKATEAKDDHYFHVKQGLDASLVAITAMTGFQQYSMEELRAGDYSRKGKQIITPEDIKFGNSFGNASSTAFGAGAPFEKRITESEASNGGRAEARRFEAHIVQLGPQRHCGEQKSRRHIRLGPGVATECVIPVQGGSVLELCISQAWSSPGRTFIESIEMTFGGILPRPSFVYASPGAVCFPRIEVSNAMPFASFAGRETPITSVFSPKGILTHVDRTIHPKKSDICSLCRRDIRVDGVPVFQLQLEYSFEVFESSSSVKLMFPEMNTAVYEAEIEGGPYVTVHDDFKQFLYASDIYPAKRTMKKGKYTATAHVTHKDYEFLERLQDMRITLQYGLPSDLNLDAFSSAHAACLGINERKLPQSAVSLDTGERRAFYFALPKKSSLPKWIITGDNLVGQMRVDNVQPTSATNSAAKNDAPTYGIAYTVGMSDSASAGRLNSKESDKEQEAKEPNAIVKSDNPAHTKEEATQLNGESPVSQAFSTLMKENIVRDGIRKTLVKCLREHLKAKQFSDFDKIYGESQLLFSGSDSELCMLKLERLDIEAFAVFGSSGISGQYRKMVRSMFEFGSKIKLPNPDEVHAFFGKVQNSDSASQRDLREKFELERVQFSTVAFRIARALNTLGLALKTRSYGKDFNEDEKDIYERNLKGLSEFVSLDGKGSFPSCSQSNDLDSSITTIDLIILCANRELLRNRPGVGYGILDNFFGSMASKHLECKSVSKLREKLLIAMKWEYLSNLEQCNRAVAFPPQSACY